MNKLFKKIGLSASVAFALMFAMVLHTGAQEKAVMPAAEGVELISSVEAMVMANTVKKLNAELVKKKANGNTSAKMIVEEPFAKSETTLDHIEIQFGKLRTGVYYFQGTTSAAGWDNAGNWDSNPPGGPTCSSIQELPCRIEIDPEDDLQDFLDQHLTLPILFSNVDHVQTKQAQTP